MNNAAIRRQLGCGPTGGYDMTQQTTTIVRPEVKARPQFTILYGVIMIVEDGGYRTPTAEELQEFLGDVAL